MNTFTYPIGDNLYLNLTNRCSNRCTFCVREKETYEGYALWLDREPTREEVLNEIGDPTRFCEIVFCGYGEPTYRLSDMVWLADAIHARGGRTRLNTNGQGSLICGRDITPDLSGRLDGINISLNASNRELYRTLCRPFSENAFEELLKFAENCKKRGLNAWFSVVDVIGEAEISACRAVAERVGIPLRVREFIE